MAKKLSSAALKQVQRHDLDQLVLAEIARRGEASSVDLRAKFGIASGNASRLFSRLVRSEKLTVRRQEHGKCSRTYYRLPDAPERVEAVVARVNHRWSGNKPEKAARRGPRVCCIWELGEMLNRPDGGQP